MVSGFMLSMAFMTTSSIMLILMPVISIWARRICRIVVIFTTRLSTRKRALGLVLCVLILTSGHYKAYSSNNRTVALRAACAPMTSTCAMSAVFDGPLIKVPYP